MQWLLTFILHRLSTINYACSILFSIFSYETLLVLHYWWSNVSQSYFLTRTLCFMIIWLSSRYITCHLNWKQSKNHLCSRWGIIYFHLYSHENWPLFEHSVFMHMSKDLVMNKTRKFMELSCYFHIWCGFITSTIPPRMPNMQIRSV